MTNFSNEGTQHGYAGGTVSLDISAFTLSTSSIMFAYCHERNSGGDHADATIDDAAGGWTKIFGQNWDFGDSSNQHTAAIWAKQPDVSQDTSIGISNAAGSVMAGIIEILPDGAYTWTLDKTADSAENSSDGDVSSNATATPAGSSDLFCGVFAFGRENGTTTWGSPTFSLNATTSGASGSPFITDVGGSNRPEVGFEFWTAGQAQNAKTGNFTWTGSGIETTVVCIVYNAGVVATYTPFPQSRRLMNNSFLTR